MPIYAVSIERTIIQTTVIEIEADDEEKAEAAARAAANNDIIGVPTPTATDFITFEWELDSDTAEITSVDEA